MTKHLVDLFQETRQTKARIEEANCPKHVEAWGVCSEAARQSGTPSGEQKVPITCTIGLSEQVRAMRCLSRRGRLLSESNKR